MAKRKLNRDKPFGLIRSMIPGDPRAYSQDGVYFDAYGDECGSSPRPSAAAKKVAAKKEATAQAQVVEKKSAQSVDSLLDSIDNSVANENKAAAQAEENA